MVYATDNLSVDYAPALAFRASASGLLAVPLSRRGKQLILWFRPETIRTVTWGGNPHEMPVVPGPHGPRLTPRKSFEAFVESVSGRSFPCRVREVFVNLIVNALKYNDKPKRVVEIGFLAPHEDGDRGAAPVEAAHQNIYYVRDNGIGIQAKHYEQIFRMFRRLHARDKYGGGTGAGLTIAKKLIERHHGQIWLSSTPGQGTTFYFTLPEENL